MQFLQRLHAQLVLVIHGLGGGLAAGHRGVVGHPVRQRCGADVARVGDCLLSAIKDIHAPDLSSRLGATNRAASSHVRQLLREQW